MRINFTFPISSTEPSRADTALESTLSHATERLETLLRHPRDGSSGRRTYPKLSSELLEQPQVTWSLSLVTDGGLMFIGVPYCS